MKANGELDGCISDVLIRTVTAVAAEKRPQESEETRAEYAIQAAHFRNEASAATAPLRHVVSAEPTETTDTAPRPPLEFGLLNGPFPAQPLLVEEYQAKHNFAKDAHRFICDRRFYTQAFGGFPETVDE